MALPAPVFREVSVSADQIAFDVLELTRPKIFDCSYFLRQCALVSGLLCQYEKTHKYDLTIFTPCRKMSISNFFFLKRYQMLLVLAIRGGAHIAERPKEG